MYHDLIGFTAGDEDGLYQSSNSPLQIIESFLEALTNADKDGRIVVNKQGKIFFLCSVSDTKLFSFSASIQPDLKGSKHFQVIPLGKGFPIFFIPGVINQHSLLTISILYPGSGLWENVDKHMSWGLQ